MNTRDFDVFAESDEAAQIFDSLVPHGDEAFMVLKAHLVAERALVAFVKARAPSPSFQKDSIQDKNSPCSSGLGLILLAEGLSLRDDIPQTHAHIVWPALKTLNGIRNQLVHELNPDSASVQKKMIKFIKAAVPEIEDSACNLNQTFHACVKYVVALLAIDRKPLLVDDAE